MSSHFWNLSSVSLGAERYIVLIVPTETKKSNKKKVLSTERGPWEVNFSQRGPNAHHPSPVSGPEVSFCHALQDQAPRGAELSVSRLFE